MLLCSIFVFYAQFKSFFVVKKEWPHAIKTTGFLKGTSLETIDSQTQIDQLYER